MAGLTSSVACLLVSAVLGGVGLPLGVPPGPEDPIMGRIAPEQCMFYLSWAGTVSPDHNSKNQTEQLLAEPEVQYFLTQMGAAIHVAVKKATDESEDFDKADKAFMKETLDMIAAGMMRPGAVFIAKIKRPPAKAAPLKKETSKPNKQASTKTIIHLVLDAQETWECRMDDYYWSSSDQHSAKPQGDAATSIGAKKELNPFEDFEGGAVFALGPNASAWKAQLRKFIEKSALAKTDKPQKKAEKNTEKKTDKQKLEEMIAEKLAEKNQEKKTEKKADEKTEKEAEKKTVEEKKPEIVSLEGEDWYCRFPQEICDAPMVFGFRGNYMILASREQTFKDILARMKKEPPQWWTDIRKKLPIERRCVTIYADFLPWIELVKADKDADELKQIQMALDIAGLSNAKAWIEVWGLDGRSFAAKSLLMLDGEPQGLLRLVSQRPLAAKDLVPIPADAGAAAAFRFDALEALDICLSAVEKSDPDSKKEAMKILGQVEKELGIDLRRGLLKAMGDTWCVYSSSNEGGWPIAVVSLRDWAGMNAAYGRLIGLAKQWAPRQENSPDAHADLTSMKPQLEQFRFADCDIYCLNCGALAPAWCMTRKEMVFGFSPQSVKAFLARDKKYEPLGRVPAVAELFSKDDGPMALGYFDSATMFRFCYNIFTLYGPAITNGLRQGGVQADLSLMPSPPSIYRHLDPSIATFRRTKYGIELTSRNTLPLPNVNVWCTLMMLTSYGSMAQGFVNGPGIIVPSPGADVSEEEKPAEKDKNAVPAEKNKKPAPAAKKRKVKRG
jgi:hypothetical protein